MTYEELVAEALQSDHILAFRQLMATLALADATDRITLQLDKLDTVNMNLSNLEVDLRSRR